MKLSSFVFLAVAASAAPLTPQEELASFRLADTNLHVELVAAEPHVLSPVAIAFDEHGRMFVAEMIDYPLGPEGGQIRCLEDVDGDGRYQSATVFADKLPYPNGVLPWNGGVLVTAAPDILFLKDTDGDKRADERRVLLTGFGTGNQQLRVNGLMWGLDNWVYGANGRSDGDIRKPGAEKTISLRGHDFRFRPDAGELETLAGRSQFGLARDDFGNRFLSWNIIPIRHEVIPSRYLVRNPNYSGTEGLHYLAPTGDPFEVFPLTPAPLTFNQESTSHFNALAGLTIYRGDALGSEYYGNAFMGESLRNLIHRRQLIADGPTFVAQRIEHRKEFLASTDPWFHPVNFATGPDGALYIADFYRHFVEHPHYVPEKLRDSQDWRKGSAHGRIWRITRKEHTAQRVDRTNLVALLSHTNAWWRDTAHRLMVEKPDVVPTRVLVNTLTNHSLAALHALWVLESRKGLDDDLLEATLRHPNLAVREHALRIAEKRPPLGQFDTGGDPRLALQLILCLGEGHSDRLAALAGEYANSHWHRLALLSSAAAEPLAFLRRITNTAFFRAPQEAHKRFLQDLGALLAKNTNAIAVLPKQSAIASLALIAGLGVTPHGLEAEARRIAFDDSASSLDRVIAVRALGAEDPVLMQLLPIPELSDAAAGKLASAPAMLSKVFERWPQWSPRIRKSILNQSVKSSAGQGQIIRALERKLMRPVELDARAREILRSIRDERLRGRARELLAENADRSEVVKRFEPALQLAGDAAKGAGIFSAKCAMCHPLDRTAPSLGPDLSGIGTRPREALLIDVLDPSRQVAPEFAAYTVSVANGDVLSGLIVGENAASISLSQPNAPDSVIARADIRDVQASGKSLMPDGLEEGMTLQEFADLLAFLTRN